MPDPIPPTGMELADLTWWAGRLLIAFALGYTAGILHTAFVKIVDKVS